MSNYLFYVLLSFIYLFLTALINTYKFGLITKKSDLKLVT